MKLELKHLAPYLPYGLKYKDIPDGFTGIRTLTINTIQWCLNDGLPLLRPLSDLTKEIEHEGEKFIPIDFLELDSCDLSVNTYSDHIEIRPLPFNEWIYAIDVHTELMEKLFDWHFDVFGLIEKGLAIDLNTVK